MGWKWRVKKNRAKNGDSMQVLASEKEEILCQCPPQPFSVFREPHGEWVPCPIDPSHCVLGENLEAHVRRCPLLKQVESLTHQTFYQKGINAGEEDDHDEIESLGVEGTGDLALSNGPVLGAVDNISEMKRNVVYNMTVPDFYKLVKKNESVHESLCKDIRDSYKVTEVCGMWIKRVVDGKLPFQEKHVMQQVSILGNSEDFGVLKNSEGGERADFGDVNGVPAVFEFGAGRG